MTTEAGTCRKDILPKLYAADWNDEQICEQRTITDGRIVPVGSGFVRKAPRRVDYLLRYERNFPLAVVEAKASTVTKVAPFPTRNTRPRTSSAPSPYAPARRQSRGILRNS